MNKKIYFAPLEGITGYVYRNAHRKYFGNVDKYFLPFIVTNQTGKLKSKELNDVKPENNKGLNAVPQVLSNHAEQLVKMAEFLEQLGYQEINLNVGCPARTVVTKGKGSGMLAVPEDLERFLDEVYRGINIRLSIKTRIGLENPEEFEEILKVYNQFPVEELIIHPRVQKDFYNNIPDLDTFARALEESCNPVCYNGDIFTNEDFLRFEVKFPQVNDIMLGRGLLRNPGLADEIKEGKYYDKKKLKAFHDELCMSYEEILSGDRNVLFKMKEVWFYMGQIFEDAEKYMKEIRKTSKLDVYKDIVDKLFEERDPIL